MATKYKRVLIKLSGEALAGEDKFGVNPEMTAKTAAQVKEIHDQGVQIAIVVGGGNFFRGRTGKNIDRATADYMGMLATVMNALALQDSLLSIGCDAKVMTAIEIRDMAEGYSRRKALDYLDDNKVVIFWRLERKPILLHGHHSGSAGGGDECGSNFTGKEHRCGIFGRSERESGCGTL